MVALPLLVIWGQLCAQNFAYLPQKPWTTRERLMSMHVVAMLFGRGPKVTTVLYNGLPWTEDPLDKRSHT